MRLLFFLVTFISTSLCAKQWDVYVGWTKPPYVIANGNTGFELELFKQIFDELGHTIMPVYVPFGRTQRLIKSAQAEIGLTMSTRHGIAPHLLTNVYVIYQNVAIAKKSRAVDIESIDDLRRYSVLGFQTASTVLGKAFNTMTKGHQGYFEIAQQSRQVSMLMMGSVDVVVMDRNIFGHLRAQMPLPKQQAVEVFPLFGISPYHAAIRDDNLRADFNRVLAEMISDGRYHRLLEQFQLVDLFEHLSTKPQAN